MVWPAAVAVMCEFHYSLVKDAEMDFNTEGAQVPSERITGELVAHAWGTECDRKRETWYLARGITVSFLRHFCLVLSNVTASRAPRFKICNRAQG
jgi:hypothetical protein